jgi:flagellar biosynthesis/type III secretory pathway M-ring protein FliF/YscJ
MAFARVEKFKFVIFILILIVIINIIRLQNRKSASNLKHNVENFPKNDELLVELEKQENEDKILWEDIEFTNYELTRKGPGEFGNAVEVKDPEELKKNEEWLKKEGFYVEVGNSISLTRALPEHRPDV